MIARVRGSLMINVLPAPSSDSISTIPFSLVMFVRTTSMPTPRPEMLVTFAAVLNPGAKIRLKASRTDISRACVSVIRPRSSAFALSFSGSMPWPSSRIAMTMWFPSCSAVTRTVPRAGLPEARRSAGVSMPWSEALRMIWMRGSFSSSMMDLSSSVSSPSSCRSMSFPVSRHRSRMRRGILLKTLAMGTILVFITAICSSVVMKSICALVSASPLAMGRSSYSCPTCVAIWVSLLRPSTSSPTRFIRLSSLATSTRIVESPPDFCAAWGAWAWPGGS